MLLKNPPTAGLQGVAVPPGQITRAAVIGSAVIVTLGAFSLNVQYAMRPLTLTGADTSPIYRIRL
jgi:hypothetical protein